MFFKITFILKKGFLKYLKISFKKFTKFKHYIQHFEAEVGEYITNFNN